MGRDQRRISKDTNVETATYTDVDIAEIDTVYIV